MKSNNKDNFTRSSMGRKPYKKPRITQVSLVPEEAVLGGCKIVGGTITGPGGSDCYLQNTILPCSDTSLS